MRSWKLKQKENLVNEILEIEPKENLVNEILEREHLNLWPRFQLRHVDETQVDEGFVPEGLKIENIELISTLEQPFATS